MFMIHSQQTFAIMDFNLNSSACYIGADVHKSSAAEWDAKHFSSARKWCGFTIPRLGLKSAVPPPLKVAVVHAQTHRDHRNIHSGLALGPGQDKWLLQVKTNLGPSRFFFSPLLSTCFAVTTLCVSNVPTLVRYFGFSIVWHGSGLIQLRRHACSECNRSIRYICDIKSKHQTNTKSSLSSQSAWTLCLCWVTGPLSCVQGVCFWITKYCSTIDSLYKKTKQKKSKSNPN